jgi:ketosteroid isomerase-like protein
VADAADNVETFKRLIAAFNEHGADAVLEFYSEDIEIYDPDQAGDGTWRGRDGARQMLDRMLSGAERTVIRDFELIPSGDRVVALMHTYFRGDGGGPEVELRDAHVLTFRDGKVTYWRLYGDPNEALTDLGLDPKRVPADGEPV